MNIEDMILNGASEEEITKALDQLRAARAKKVEEELREQEAAEQASAHEELIREARAYAVNAILAYSEAFDLNDGEPWTEEDVEELEKLLIKIEQMIPMYKKLYEIQKKMGLENMDFGSALGLFGL